MPDLLPARMLNEFVYCPRLAYLEFAQQEWADNADVAAGRLVHRRVDQERGAVPEPSDLGDEDQLAARSVYLSAPGEGLVARIDLIESRDGRVCPVDYKRGSPPSKPPHAWPADRVQLCAQGLILKEAGYRCEEGVLYYAAARERVTIPFDEALVAETRRALLEMRAVLASGRIPPPLEDSPKCPRCSLVGICLPDEVHFLRRVSEEEARRPDGLRKLFPARDDALPLYVQDPRGRVGIGQNRLVVRVEGKVVHEARLLDVSQLCVFGNVQVSTQALRRLADEGIPVAYFSMGNRFQALVTGMGHKNVELRLHQYRTYFQPEVRLGLAKRFVRAKLQNARTLLRRNAKSDVTRTLRLLQKDLRRVDDADGLPRLLGIEGLGSRHYYESFATMLREPGGWTGTFDFRTRNRRPPRDPVNALLSFCYSLLCKDCTAILYAVGFDPFLGFFHQPRYGRPALALDLMEEFRPLIADSVVIKVINNGELKAGDFTSRAGAVRLDAKGRKKLIQAYERRMDELVTHPLFGYRLSYRRLLEMQARLLGRSLAGELDAYPAFRTR